MNRAKKWRKKRKNGENCKFTQIQYQVLPSILSDKYPFARKNSIYCFFYFFLIKCIKNLLNIKKKYREKLALNKLILKSTQLNRENMGIINLLKLNIQCCHQFSKKNILRQKKNVLFSFWKSMKNSWKFMKK